MSCLHLRVLHRKHTQRRQYEGHNTPLGYYMYTDIGIMGHGQHNSQGVYCGLSTASEMFLIFTTQVYSCLCKYSAIVFKPQQ